MDAVLKLVFEIGMVLIFLLCLIDAHRKGRRRILELVGAALAGLLLEVLAIIYLGIYDYFNGFLLVVMDVPICIGLGWGIAVYISMGISDNLGLGRGVRPVIDGLLALNIDLALDVVAIRIGFWNWEYGGFFGVPYINYVVWFTFVYCCSVTIRWIRTEGLENVQGWNLPHGFLLVPFGAIDNLMKRTWSIICALLLVWRISSKVSHKVVEEAPLKFEPLMFTGLSAIHIFFLAVLIWNRWFGIIWLLVISLAMLALGAFLHLVPLVHRIGIHRDKRGYGPVPAIVTQFMRL